MASLLQKLLGTITGRGAAVVAVAKPGPVLAELSAWAAAGGTTARPTAALAAVQARMATVAAELAGQRRQTSFRHEVVDMDAGELVKKISSSRRAQTIVHQLAVTFKPSRVLELGSAFGSATMAMASGLAAVASVRLDGIELDPWRAGIADTNVKSVLGDRGAVHAGSIGEVLPGLVREGGKAGLVFVDAVHRLEETWAYHLCMLDSVHSGAVVVYDDVDWSQDMTRCWREIVATPDVVEAVLLHNRWGVAVYRCVPATIRGSSAAGPIASCPSSQTMTPDNPRSRAQRTFAARVWPELK